MISGISPMRNKIANDCLAERGVETTMMGVKHVSGFGFRV